MHTTEYSLTGNQIFKLPSLLGSLCRAKPLLQKQWYSSGGQGEKKRPYFCIITAFSNTKSTALWELARQKLLVNMKSSMLWHVNAREKLPCIKVIMRAIWHHFSVPRSLLRVSSLLQSRIPWFEGLCEQYSPEKGLCSAAQLSFCRSLSPPGNPGYSMMSFSPCWQSQYCLINFFKFIAVSCRSSVNAVSWLLQSWHREILQKSYLHLWSLTKWKNTAPVYWCAQLKRNSTFFFFFFTLPDLRGKCVSIIYLSLCIGK